MVERIINWIFFGIICSLLPLFIYITIHYIFDSVIVKNDCIPELLFFTVMACTNCLSDTIKLKNRGARDNIINIIIFTLILFLIFSAVLYGAFQLYNVSNNISFSNNKIFMCSLYLTIIIAVTGTILQIFIGKIEKEVNNG